MLYEHFCYNKINIIRIRYNTQDQIKFSLPGYDQYPYLKFAECNATTF